MAFPRYFCLPAPLKEESKEFEGTQECSGVLLKLKEEVPDCAKAGKGGLGHAELCWWTAVCVYGVVVWCSTEDTTVFVEDKEVSVGQSMAVAVMLRVSGAAGKPVQVLSHIFMAPVEGDGQRGETHQGVAEKLLGGAGVEAQKRIAKCLIEGCFVYDSAQEGKRLDKSRRCEGIANIERSLIRTLSMVPISKVREVRDRGFRSTRERRSGGCWQATKGGRRTARPPAEIFCSCAAQSTGGRCHRCPRLCF